MPVEGLGGLGGPDALPHALVEEARAEERDRHREDRGVARLVRVQLRRLLGSQDRCLLHDPSV